MVACHQWGRLARLAGLLVVETGALCLWAVHPPLAVPLRRPVVRSEGLAATAGCPLQGTVGRPSPGLGRLGAPGSRWVGRNRWGARRVAGCRQVAFPAVVGVAGSRWGATPVRTADSR
ncbi:hypothetical protein GCM10010428_75200 [Actinosynnema pretiosum subsp. pretiosum]